MGGHALVAAVASSGGLRLSQALVCAALSLAQVYMHSCATPLIHSRPHSFMRDPNHSYLTPLKVYMHSCTTLLMHARPHTFMHDPTYSYATPLIHMRPHLFISETTKGLHAFMHDPTHACATPLTHARPHSFISDTFARYFHSSDARQTRHNFHTLLGF